MGRKRRAGFLALYLQARLVDMAILIEPAREEDIHSRQRISLVVSLKNQNGNEFVHVVKGS